MTCFTIVLLLCLNLQALSSSPNQQNVFLYITTKVSFFSIIQKLFDIVNIIQLRCFKFKKKKNGISDFYTTLMFKGNCGYVLSLSFIATSEDNHHHKFVSHHMQVHAHATILEREIWTTLQKKLFQFHPFVETIQISRV